MPVYPAGHCRKSWLCLYYSAGQLGFRELIPITVPLLRSQYIKYEVFHGSRNTGTTQVYVCDHQHTRKTPRQTGPKRGIHVFLRSAVSHCIVRPKPTRRESLVDRSGGSAGRARQGLRRGYARLSRGVYRLHRASESCFKLVG